MDKIKCFTCEEKGIPYTVYEKTGRCRICHKKYRDAYYKKNKKISIERIHNRKKTIIKYIRLLKSNLQCEKCNENFIGCLQFHHKDPKNKDISIAQIANRGWSLNRIQKEIKKCSVLCANCHFKLHWNEKTSRHTIY